jgi:superfamily I DNA and/or RNA helicase
MEAKVKENKNGSAFIKKVAEYFMDFLETDFHKRRSPKRSIQYRNSSNLLIGLGLNKYPAFNTIVRKAITHGFERGILDTIQKGVYRTNISKNLLDLIKLQLGKINSKQISKIIDQVADEVEKSASLHMKEYDQALTSSLEAIAKVVKTELALPFVSNLEKPLENLNLGDENNVYLMEEELTAVLVALLENKISEIIKLILSKTKVDVVKQIKDVLEIEDVKSIVSSFFENFQVGDLFSEIYEMERNRTILDKQEFYLYFCDITFNNAKYPIFYIPFSVGKQGDTLTVEFDSQVYINKKALEYITQEYNRETNHHGNLQTITERIIYLAQHKEDFRELVSEILNEITNFFDLDKKIDITDAEHQVAKGFWVRASNTCYVALFDKSDEALVNDYEEILKLLASDDSVLAGAFNKLIDDFIHNNPQSFHSDVESEWDNTETSERLVFNSPIPLNSEQLQILSAIKKEGCKYIIVEGPPGTGKSHTITAVVFDHVLKGQSVLVLSDKKEALDVVEDKITETLNKVRHDKKFQNPILRLGKTGNTYSQILATNTIENIKTHLQAVKKDRGELESDIEKVGNSLKEDLQAEILAYGEIDLKEIHELIDLETYFEEKGFPFDIDEVIKNSESAGELEELRSIITNLKTKLKDCSSDFDPQTKPSPSLVNNIKLAISLLEKSQTGYDKYFRVADIRGKAIYLHNNKADFTLSGKTFQEIKNLINETSSHDTIYKLFGLEKPRQFADAPDFLKALSFVRDCFEHLNSTVGAKLAELSMAATFSDFNYTQIQWFIEQYKSLKIPVLGYLFRSKQVAELNAKFKKTFMAEKVYAPHKLIEKLKDIKLIVEQIAGYKKDLPPNIKTIDLIGVLTALVKDNSLQKEFRSAFASANNYYSAIAQLQKTDWYNTFAPKDIEELRKIGIAGNAVSAFTQYKAIGTLNNEISINTIEDFLDGDNLSAEIESLKKYSDFLAIITDNFEDITYVISSLNHYPTLAKQSKIDETSIKTFLDNALLKISELEWAKLIRYLGLQHKTKKDFANILPLNYAGEISKIEELATLKMTYEMDKRFIQFYEKNRNDALTIKNIIRQKRRFPRDKFDQIKSAFPCILAGIRDYAEYVPLEPEIFDLVIIDEASQVSIAQAFPALLRAKKVLIFGDKKQFSNVKSAQARTETNKEYLNNLKDTFLRCVSDDETKLVKLEKFNIKTSILEFFDFISNYNIQLLKHFRGYPEIISYSKKYFYQDSLQVMKIRGKPIDEVLRFSLIKHDGKKELAQNTNYPEVEFIISELQKLKEADSSSSVGIITPHTNQQKLLVEMISKLPEKDYFYDKLNLKIMTFDTCQGEERDIIFYSMVATEEDDRLWGVFIKDLSNVDIEEDGKIKAQRLVTF